MVVFNKIQAKINKLIQDKDFNDYLGTFEKKDMDEEDLVELKTWEINSETIRSKKIGEREFYFDLYFAD